MKNLITGIASSILIMTLLFNILEIESATQRTMAIDYKVSGFLMTVREEGHISQQNENNLRRWLVAKLGIDDSDIHIKTTDNDSDKGILCITVSCPLAIGDSRYETERYVIVAKREQS